MHNPLSALMSFLRRQISGAPAEHVEAAVKGIEDHVAAEVGALEAALRAEFGDRLAAIEAKLGIGTPATPPAA